MSEEDSKHHGESEDGVIVCPGFDPPLQRLDEEKRNLLNEFRSVVDGWDLDELGRRYVRSDVVLLRYLRARSWNVTNAAATLEGTIQWRRLEGIDNIRAPDHESQCKNGKMFVHGEDRYGRPVVYLGVNSEHDPHPDDKKLRFMIYTIEIALRRMDHSRGVEKSVWICDCRNYAMKHNGSLGFAKSLLAVLQHHFVDTLAYLVLLDAPFLFRTFWKVIAPFLDPVTVRKVKFLTLGSNDFEREMGEIITMDQLIQSHGGRNAWKFDPDVYYASLLEEEAVLYSQSNAPVEGS